jgi:hypothetical protein
VRLGKALRVDELRRYDRTAGEPISDLFDASEVHALTIAADAQRPTRSAPRLSGQTKRQSWAAGGRLGLVPGWDGPGATERPSCEQQQGRSYVNRVPGPPSDW